jgi:hypothetical protein
MAKIKTFEQACKALKIDAKALPDVSKLPEKHQAAMVAHYKLIVIAEALNEGWQPDWSNWNEYKYFPYFKVNADASKPSGSGLSYYGYGARGTSPFVGSRLCFKSWELAEYAGKQFKDLYEQSYLIN